MVAPPSPAAASSPPGAVRGELQSSLFFRLLFPIFPVHPPFYPQVHSGILSWSCFRIIFQGDYLPVFCLLSKMSLHGYSFFEITVFILKSSARTPFLRSSHCSGMDTVAAGVPRGLC